MVSFNQFIYLFYFISLTAILHKERGRQANIHDIGLHKSTSRDLLYPEMLMEGDLILQVDVHFC